MPRHYVVTASGLRMRRTPKLEPNNTLSIISRGSIVEWSAHASDSAPGGWLFVHAPPKKGWVFAKYLVDLDHPLAPPHKGFEEFPWMPIALHELGQSEVPGPESNPRITTYQLSTEIDGELRPSDETPWCSDFACWCVESAGYVSTNSASARSWLSWGRPIKHPRRGVIVVLSRGPSGGHVGFFVKGDGKAEHISILGGNQGNAVSIQRYETARVLGYRVIDSSLGVLSR